MSNDRGKWVIAVCYDAGTIYSANQFDSLLTALRFYASGWEGDGLWVGSEGGEKAWISNQRVKSFSIERATPESTFADTRLVTADWFRAPALQGAGGVLPAVASGSAGGADGEPRLAPGPRDGEVR